MDKIRVIKLLIYEGPRDVVEEHIKHTINGTRWQSFNGRDQSGNRLDGDYSITGITITQFPEVLEQLNNKEKEDV